MSEKTLSFELQIAGLSNENIELAKVVKSINDIAQSKRELTKAYKDGQITEDLYIKKTALLTNELNTQKTKQAELKKVMDSASDSMNRKIALLAKMTAESKAGGEAIEKKLAPAILKLNNEIKAGENTRGVFSRNVGNYPELAGKAGSAMGQLSGALGGVAGETGNVIASFLSAGGPLGILTAGVAVLAKAWKTTQDNIKLYLESADKVAMGSGAFEQDSETARKAARRRGEGQMAEGLRLVGEYQVRLLKGGKDLTAEERTYFESIVKSGEQMQRNGRQIINDTYGIKKKLEWERKYSALLMEQEKLSDEKLEKQTQWEELEAKLVQQRAIVSDQESTSLEKKKAGIDADIIANKLVKEKTDFVTRQYDNLVAISEITGLQEVNEDKINDLLKQRNTIQKEYFADQVQINRLKGRASGRASGGASGIIGEMEMPDGIDQATLIEQTQAATDAALDSKQAFLDKKGEIEKDAWDKGMALAYENYEKQKAAAEQNARDIIQIDLAKLDQKEEIRNAEIAIAGGIGDTIRLLAGKNKSLAIAGMGIEKAAAIAQIISSIGIANAKAIAVSPLTVGMPWVAINTATGAISIANLIAQAAKSIGEIKGFAQGGKITGGVPVNTGTVDNRLIVANESETILTARHVALLGGSAAMRRIRVPGYANGGYVGQSTPEIPSQGFDYQQLASLMNNIQVVLDVNKINAAQNEIAIINSPSGI